MATRRNPRGTPERRARNPGGSPAEPMPTRYDKEKPVSWGDEPFERINEEEADKAARRRSRQLPAPKASKPAKRRRG